MNGLFTGKTHADAVYAKYAVFFDRDNRLVLGRFKDPVRIHGAAIGALLPTETLSELEKRGIPTFDSTQALNNSEKSSIIYSLESIQTISKLINSHLPFIISPIDL